MSIDARSSLSEHFRRSVSFGGAPKLSHSCDKDFLKKIKSQVETHIVPHLLSLKKSEYEASVIGFLQKALDQKIPLSEVKQSDPKLPIDQIIEEIPKCDALMGVLQKNAAFFIDEFGNFVNQRSNSTTQLLSFVERLKTADAKQALEIKTLDKNIRKIARYLFGKTKQERKETMKALEIWSGEKGPAYAREYLQEHFNKMKEVALIPFKKTLWTQDKNTPMRVQDISLREISRVFVAEDKVCFDVLTINGVSLLPFEKKEGESRSEFKERFFSMLMSKISKRENVSNRAKLLVAAENWEKENPANLIDDLPELPVLQLCTMSIWNLAQESLFSQLKNFYVSFNNTRPVENSQCMITIDQNGSFSVTQIKNYKTYRQKNTNDPWSSRILDKDSDLCEYTFSWTFYPITDNGRPSWQGYFEIPHMTINGEHASEDEKWMIFESITQQEPSPTIQRLRSSQTLNRRPT